MFWRARSRMARKVSSSLGDIWMETHQNYIEMVRRGNLGDRKQLEIMGRIKTSARQSKLIGAEKKEEVVSLVEENKKRKNEKLQMYQATDTLYIDGKLAKKNANGRGILRCAHQGENGDCGRM